MTPTILVDFDGVIYDIHTPLVDLLKRHGYPEFGLEDIARWDWPDDYPALRELIHRYMYDGPAHEKGKTHIGAIEGLQALGQLGRVVICSATTAGQVAHKIAWLKDHGFWPDHTVFTFNKALVAGDILIDDRPQNVRDFTESGTCRTGIVVDRPWNRHDDWPLRAESWPDIVTLTSHALLGPPRGGLVSVSEAGGGAVKHDHGKLRLDLIPVRPLLELADVYTRGAKKYSANNWRGGLAWSRVYRALLSHGFKWHMGEERDSEDGQLHMGSVAWCAFTLMEYAYTHPELDDRPIAPHS